MKECILNGDMQCPYRGCFDTPDVYLDYRITFLSDSNYTLQSQHHRICSTCDLPGYKIIMGIDEECGCCTG